MCDDTAFAFKTCNLHGVDVAEFQAYSITKPVLGNRGRFEFFQRVLYCMNISTLQRSYDILEPFDRADIDPRTSREDSFNERASCAALWSCNRRPIS